MSTWEARFNAAVRDFIDGRPLKRWDWKSGPEGVVEAQEVTYIEQDTEGSGYCETCYYEEIVLRISYIEKGTGRSRQYSYYGDMAALMRELG